MKLLGGLVIRNEISLQNAVCTCIGVRCELDTKELFLCWLFSALLGGTSKVLQKEFLSPVVGHVNCRREEEPTLN